MTTRINRQCLSSKKPDSGVNGERYTSIDRRSVPPAWLDPVKLGAGHVAKCLDVIFERLFRFVGQLRKCVERKMTCDFQPDQGLDVSLLRFSDADLIPLS